MKQPVMGVLIVPTKNKYTVRVTRGDSRHLPVIREYSCSYDVALVYSLSYWASKMNVIFQKNVVDFFRNYGAGNHA